jgi:hypothetical protein
MTKDQSINNRVVATKNYTTWRILPNIRRYYPNGHNGPSKLQQAWQCLEEGNIEWRDIPIEVANG